MTKITIGITDNSKYDAYAHWIMHEPDTEVVRLGYAMNNRDEAGRCHAILFSGGDEDIHPRFYDKPEFLPFCTGGVDERRDEFELNLIDYALANHLPLLGICRGLQIVNVYFGGTLVPDIPSTGVPDHSRFADGNDRYHKVSASQGSRLSLLTGESGGEVNSAHHQAADRLGNGLKATAFSGDGVIEGMERSDDTQNSFLLLVQWHPERMREQENPFASRVRDVFLDSVRLRQRHNKE